ncbi:MAG TPA: hypothetical protein VK403_14480 [Allosphingosinicella sp.]|nr:hypothetical protein [Allosphingosinicella sp.]
MYNPRPDDFFKLLSARIQDDSFLHASQLRSMAFSVGLGQYAFFESPVESCSGYIIWAFVCDDTIIRLHDEKRFPSYVYEWSEGTIALILDICFRQSGARPTASMVRQALPRDIDRVAFVKRDRLRLYRSVAGRTTKVSLAEFVPERVVTSSLS